MAREGVSVCFLRAGRGSFFADQKREHGSGDSFVKLMILPSPVKIVYPKIRTLDFKSRTKNTAAKKALSGIRPSMFERDIFL